MNLKDYYNLKFFLKTSTLPTGLTLLEQQQLKNQSTHYIIRNHILYRRNKKTPQEPLKVIKQQELKNILFSLHERSLAGHFGIEGTYNQSKERYYWPNMYCTIAEYIKTCDICQRQ